jgi:cell division protein FtsN
MTIQSDAKYQVIGGCFRVRQNADNFLAKLLKNGFKSEMKIQANGSFLVIVQSYSDKNEAIIALRNLREAEPQIGYWISGN